MTNDEQRKLSRIFSQNRYAIAYKGLNEKTSSAAPSRILGKTQKESRKINALQYIGGKIGTGALGIVEGAVDLIAGGLSDLFGNDEFADYAFQYDTWVNDLNEKLDEGYKPKKVGKFFGDVSSGLGQSATFLIPYVGQILFVAGMWGNAVSSASQKTGKVGGREYVYGAGSAAVEWVLERFISGSGQTLETLGKQTAKNVGSKVVKSFGKTAAKTTTTKMVASQLVSSAAGEAVEEFLGSVWDPIWQRWSGVDDEAKVDWGDAAYSALVGLVSGGIMGSVSTGVQTAYEGKRGADLNADAKKRDVLLKQARYLVDNAEAQGLTSGSDTVAGHLAELRGGLTSYQNAKDKNSAGAMIALGKIERTLVATELNVITEARVNYIASLSEAERDNLAEWANAYFKDAGVEITAKDLADTDNLVTRTIATMDWVGKIVDTTLGKNRVLNTEIAEAMARQTMSEKQLADEKKKATAQKESDRIMTAAKETAVSLDTAKWKGEDASYFYEAGGERAYLAIEKNADGTYQAYMFDDNKFRPLNNLTAEQVTSLVDGAKNKLADATKGKNADEKNKRSKGEVTPTEKTENAESAEKRGESGTKTEEGVGESTTKSSLGADPTVLEEGSEEKGESEYVEKEFKATPDEVKRASKMVKEFKFLPAKQREAIIEMMRTAGNIDKLTVSSIAHFMASREGLNVRFMKNHVAEGSFDVLKKSGERLILLDPKYNNGKHYRADILAHELYHDIIAESSADAGKALNEMIHESVSPSLRREIADRYAKHFNGKSISEYLAEKNEKWTETNVKEYFKEYTKISYAEIMEEVSAGVMGKIVGQRAFIRQLRAKGLLARTFDHIRNICGAIANRAMTVGGDSSPGFTIAFRDALQFKALYSQAVIATNTDLTPALVTDLKKALQSVAETDEEKARTKYSFAGVHSKTADKSKLSEAKIMEANNTDSDEIRRRTGWYKGLDGKWRYEIDDSAMQIKETKYTYITLGDLIEHAELFEAYPQLIYMPVIFASLNGARGAYSLRDGDITIERNLRKDEEELKDVLVHEIQHAIQDIEGFASGASVEFWEKRLEEGFDSREDFEKKQEQEILEQIKSMRSEDLRNDTTFVSDMEELMKQVPDHPRGKINWDTLEQIEEDSPAWKYFDRERTKLEKQYGEDRVFEFMLMHDRLNNLKHKNERSATRLYWDTAGEIEARNVTERRRYSKGLRSFEKPNTRSNNVVFADASAVKYYAKEQYDPEIAAIKEQIENAKDVLNKMDAVFDSTVPKEFSNKHQAAIWATEELKKYGYQADRQGFGIIYFDSKAINKAMNYLDTNEEKAAILALHRVLKRGIQIGEHGNHKNREKQTITFAAPVILNGTRGNMAVVVNLHGNKYYTHRIVLPDGTAFKFNENKNADQEPQRGVPERSLANATRSASNESIPQSTPKVNSKFSLPSDADYLDAVSRGDMVTAQSMVDEAARKAMQNSLVRDAAGKLLKVYHGSSSKFTISKHSKINAHGNSHGRGFYFTDYKSLAESYQKDGGQLLEGYLNIEKPLSEEKITIKKTDLLKLIKATCEAEAKQLVEDGSYDNIRDALPDTWISNYVMTYGMNINTAYREVADIIYSGSDNDVDMLAEITNASGGSETALTLTHDLLGYDGVIFENDEGHHEYVILISNEFKSADPVTYDDDGNVIPLSERFQSENPDTRYSLPTLPDASNVEAELNERDWGFEWTDGKLLDNVKTVRAYLEKAYPDAAIAIEIDNKARRIEVTSVSRFNDFEERSEADQELHDFLTSIGIKDEQIGPFLSSFNPIEKAKVAKTIKDMDKKPRPKVYYRNQIAKTTEGILSQIITPMAGGDAKMLGKDKQKLVTWLLRRMNTAENAEDRRKIARIVAEAFIARTVYADMEVNAEYETMLVDGTIETYEEVKSYLGKIRADSVKADVISTYDKSKGGAVLRRWLTKGDGISIHDAIAKLQDQGILTDTDAKNEADMLIALNEEYERLKGLTELRREFLPLANIDKARLDEIQKNIEDIMLGFFRSGGKETKYSQLLRRYKALLSERDAKNQKELEELEAKLSEQFTKRIDKMREEADRQMGKTKEFYDRRLTESQYAYRYAKKLTRIIADARNLRDYVNRDYMPAEFMENPQTKGIAKAFLKAVSRTNVKVEDAKEAARIMLEWADNIKKTDETFIGGLGVGAMTQDEYDALSRVARSTSEISLEIEELEDFHTALQAAIRNYKSYDMLWDGERYVQIGEKAREAVEQQLRAKEESERDGWFAKMSRTIRKIGLQFLDPLSAAAAIDGYNYDGVFQELLTKLAYAEAEKNKMMGELRAPFEEFLKNHKKYEERLASEVIELTPEIKITVGQAITLSEMYKRDQAKAALAISRIAFNMDDGTVRKLEGYGETPFLSTPNGKKVEIDTAKEVRRVYYNNRANALAMLHEYGYDTSLREGAVAFEQFERDLAAAETEAMNVIRKFGDQRKQIIEDIAKQFTDEDREFIKLVSDFFQTTSKKAKKDADLRNLGYTNVIEGYYFPIKRRSADMAKNIADGSFFSDFITSANISFNHSTMHGAKASIDIFNVWDILTEHIEGLALWEHLYLPVQNINKIYNKNVATQTGPVTVKNILSERTDGDWGKWLADLLLDVQGARRKETKTTFDSLINWVRGKYAVYQLGLNPQTVVKQTLSWAAASQYISPASIAKGLLHPRLNHEQLNRVSAVAAERIDDATVIRAMSNTEKFSKAAEKTMWGITKMDRFVNEALFAMCQEEVAAKNPAMPIGSEENLIEAGKLVSEVILKVQDSSDVMTKSQAARSSSELLKAFTMFQSAGIKMFSRIFENIGFVARYRTLSKADQNKYGARYKQAQKQLAKSVGALSAVAVLTALIVQLFKWIYNKDREDKDGNEITVLEDFATDAATEIVGVVPIIGDIVDYYVNGYEVSNFFSDTFNDTLKAVGQVVSIGARAVGGDVIEDWEVGSMLRKVSRAAGSLTGIPVRNVENTLSGLVRRVAPEAGYSYDTLFYDPNYNEDVKKALNEGDTEMAAHIVELMMKRKKTGSKTYSAETINTLVELRNIGYENVFPKTVKIDDMDRKTYKKFISVYSKADEAVDKLVTSKEFKALADLGTDEASPQATAITTLYNAYFDLAEHDVLGEELTRGAAYISVTDAHNLMLVKAYDKAIKLETVETKGSRKAMLKAYMKKLGMDQTAQAYAAYSCGFRTDGVKNIILADLKGRKDENELLIALGLKEAEEKGDAA